MTSVFPLAVLLCLSSGLLAAYDAPSCPTGWTQFGSRCFSFNIGPKSWPDAETFCQTAGGHLASIHSNEEHIFIRNYIKGVSGSYRHSWIGGTDAVQEGTWLWSDGSKMTYKSWNAGEPNNAGGAENCLEMNWGGENWNDGACTNQLPFVCSKNLKLERRTLYLPGFFRVLQEHFLQCGAA
ncbi:galactose-specific lectin nattectin-like isoform X1 [Sander lucioperca]|uniref:Galactose-specific lectin nattectin-like n=1 Tax=Sander lucioperca TaxID=283035 RepID=A0A8D0AJT4_SANLU|nr:galactose-specific lectin nattectin-like isoform X1 [Sander lucioperca]XP_035859895.1 galactose-specific lectin nattectin-like isoform X1 [Sander lucioperca]XP_035859896.1 galactose-specific lectin nattectin-like isoform X1 [Sander lucioperca]